MTFFAANASLALGFVGFIWSSLNTKDIRCIFLLAIAVFCGYIYQVKYKCYLEKVLKVLSFLLL